MRLWELEAELQGIRSFAEPKIEWEQYPTSAHIAAHMIYTMDSSFDDISDNVIADFGCGGGILGIACDLLGAAHVVGVDIDSIALDVARRNADTAEVDIDLIRADICGSCPLRVNSVDVVVMNPPFGTRNKGVDMGFVFAGLRVARKAVYSLHKSSTRAHVVRSAEKHGYGATVVAELRYDIPAMYKFHKSRSKDIAVDFIRFSIPDSG